MGRAVDNLAIALCISIGSGVGWLLAIYTEPGPRLLIGNVAYGIVGAFLCALLIAWFDPVFVVPGLIFVGPIFSLLTIVAGQAIKSAIARTISREHH